jgi:hypothetical protein
MSRFLSVLRLLHRVNSSYTKAFEILIGIDSSFGNNMFINSQKVKAGESCLHALVLVGEV